MCVLGGQLTDIPAKIYSLHFILPAVVQQLNPESTSLVVLETWPVLQGSTVITCGEDGTCRMYNLHTAQCEMLMRGHKGAILDISLEWEVGNSFDGPLALTGGEDFKACVWDLLADSEEPPMTILSGHTGWVTSVQVRSSILFPG